MILPPLRPLPPAQDLLAAVDALSDSDELGSGYVLGWLTRLVARTAGEEGWDEVATAAGKLLARLTGDQGLSPSIPTTASH